MPLVGAAPAAECALPRSEMPMVAVPVQRATALDGKAPCACMRSRVQALLIMFVLHRLLLSYTCWAAVCPFCVCALAGAVPALRGLQQEQRQRLRQSLALANFKAIRADSLSRTQLPSIS